MFKLFELRPDSNTLCLIFVIDITSEGSLEKIES